MSIISGDLGERSALDYTLLGLAGAVVAAAIGLGLYGSSTGFIQSNVYWRANDPASLACAVVSAGCGLYLMIEIFRSPRAGAILGVCVICAMFGFFAVSKGIPAAVTSALGKPGHVEFTVDRLDWGSKNCSNTVVATNPEYEDFRICIKYFDGRPVQAGQVIEVSGPVSNWGIIRDDFRLRR